MSFHGHDVPLLARARRIRRGPSRRYAWLGRAPAAAHGARVVRLSGAPGHADRARASPARLRVHRFGIDTQRLSACGARPAGVRARAHDRPPRGEEGALRTASQRLQAFVRARSATLTIVGAGPLCERLRAQARELAGGGPDRFVGAVPHDQGPEIMRSHDVLMAPSTVAGDGDRDSGLMVLREAAASGLVAIATRHGGLPRFGRGRASLASSSPSETWRAWRRGSCMRVRIARCGRGWSGRPPQDGAGVRYRPVDGNARGGVRRRAAPARGGTARARALTRRRRGRHTPGRRVPSTVLRLPDGNARASRWSACDRCLATQRPPPWSPSRATPSRRTTSETGT